ncbi:hypothetical protein D3C72_2034320 [compost metagenome]
MQKTMPNSSAATENTKSVWLSGMMRLTMPSPGPRPNQSPRMIASRAVSIWKVSPSPVRNLSIRPATCGSMV